MSRAFLILALLLPATGCASAQAKAPVEHVALEVPSVPERVIEPVAVEAPPPPQPDATVPPPATPAVTRQRPSNRGESQRAEPKPETLKPDVTEPDAPPPVPPLRIGTQSNGPEVEKQIRESLARNKTLLDGFDARTWSDDRKTSLDTAKDSIVQAEQALKAGNIVLARNLADRAENIAKQLVGR